VIDQALIAQVQGGSDAAFAEFWHLVEAQVTRQVKSMLGPRSNAVDDAVQEIAIQLWRKIGQYKPTGSFEGWLHQLTNHRVIDFMRHHDDAVDLVPMYVVRDGVEIPIDVADPSQDLNSHLRSREIEKFIDELPERQRRVLELHRAGHDHEEIAAMMRITSNNSYVLLNRALTNLKKKLGIACPRKPRPRRPLLLPPATTAVEIEYELPMAA